MNALECPPRETLKKYLAGKLTDEDSAVLESHLARCQPCEGTASQLDHEPDTFADILQSADTETDCDAHPASQVTSRSSPDFSLGPARRLIDPSPAGSAVRHTTQITGSIGSYDLVRQLGRGGMGTVYQARHRELQKDVAIKLLPKLSADREDVVARFRREMRAAGRLDHPAIVKATDAGESGGVHFLVMEIAEGLDVSRITRLVDPLTIADACEIARQAALGLDYAHEQGVIHRDIKPSNLMLSSDGKIKILDFGLAQLMYWEEPAAELTTVGQMMGTLDYMAPEQGSRRGGFDRRCDIYSLGATLFKLLTGCPPLASDAQASPLEKLRLLSEHQILSVNNLRPDVPDGLAELLHRMLATQPGDRPTSAEAVANELTKFCESSSLKSLVKTAQMRSREESNSHSQPQQFGSPEPAHEKDSSAGGRWLTWLGASASFAALIAGILVTLELTKGQLVIESDDADVTVQITSVDEEHRTQALQIKPGATSTRLRDGTYEITLNKGSDRFSISNHTFTIQRGDVEVARVTRLDDSQESPKETVVRAGNPLAQPGDTLAIYLPPVIPLQSNLVSPAPPIPVFQAGTRAPVQGLPFRIDDSGDILLPLVGNLNVAGLPLAQIRAAIKNKYVAGDILRDSEDSKIVVSVNFLMRATEALEVKNLTVASDGQEPAAKNPQLTEVIYDGDPLETWLHRLKSERSPSRLFEAIAAIEAMADPALAEAIQPPIMHFAGGPLSNPDTRRSCLSIIAKLAPEDFFRNFTTLAKQMQTQGRLSALLTQVPSRRSLFRAERVSQLEEFLTWCSDSFEDESVSQNHMIEIAQSLKNLLTASHSGDRYLSDECREAILRQLQGAGDRLNNRNFWLAETEPRASWCDVLQEEIRARALWALEQHASVPQELIHPAIVLAHMNDPSRVDPSETEELVSSLSRFLEFAASGHLDDAIELIEVPAGLEKGAGPLQTSGGWVTTGRNPTRANALTSILNLIDSHQLRNECREPLNKLHAVLAQQALRGDSYQPLLAKVRNKTTWLGYVTGFEKADQLKTALLQAAYFQSGMLLDKDLRALRRRFTEKPADLEPRSASE